MRLIDADALIKYFSLWLDDEHYVERTFKVLAEEDIIPIIDNAPTIEAEPTIEQINNYCKTRNLTILTNDLFYHLQKQSNCKVKEGEDK